MRRARHGDDLHRHPALPALIAVLRVLGNKQRFAGWHAFAALLSFVHIVQILIGRESMARPRRLLRSKTRCVRGSYQCFFSSADGFFSSLAGALSFSGLVNLRPRPRLLIWTASAGRL